MMVDDGDVLKCPSCGKVISSEVEMCPQCGYLLWHEPDRKRVGSYGKYIGAIVLIIILIGFLFLFTEYEAPNDGDTSLFVPGDADMYTYIDAASLKDSFSNEDIMSIPYIEPFSETYLSYIDSVTIFGCHYDDPVFAYALSVNDKAKVNDMLWENSDVIVGNITIDGFDIVRLDNDMAYVWIDDTVVLGDYSFITKVISTSIGEEASLYSDKTFQKAMSLLPEHYLVIYSNATTIMDEWAFVPDNNFQNIDINFEDIMKKIVFSATSVSIDGTMAVAMGFDNSSSASLAALTVYTYFESMSSAHENKYGAPITNTITRDDSSLVFTIKLPEDHPVMNYSDIFS